MAARDELVAAIAGRYAQGDRGERGRILDEFAAVSAADATIRDLPHGDRCDPRRLPPVRPHMLRHSCGAKRGYDLRLIQDYLGHCDPRHTVHYTRTAASRFDGLWRR